jgi:hypothetical protein
MSTTERCDEIVRLIDEALRDCEPQADSDERSVSTEDRS